MPESDPAVGPKKQLERWQLDQFRAHCAAFPEGSIRASESPDFLVDTACGVLGVELHGIYPAGESLRGREGEWDSIIRRAQELYERSALPPVRVGVRWSEHARVGAPGRDRLAEVLASTVRQVCPPPGGSVRIEYSGQHGIEFPPGVQGLRVDRIGGPPENCWFFPQARFVPTWTPQDLQRAIDEKDRKLRAYWTQCDRAWLILLANHSYASSWGEHSDATREHTYVTGFERVFVYRMLPTEIVELRIRPLADTTRRA